MTSENNVITLANDDELQKELILESFRLEFHHEYKTNGERIKIDKPFIVECVMPLCEYFKLPTYNKREIIGMLSEMLSEKLIADMREEE